MIRPMTIDEIKRALRHGAQMCIERAERHWALYGVLRQDGAFCAAKEWLTEGDGIYAVGRTPEDSATYLLLVAEAVE